MKRFTTQYHIHIKLYLWLSCALLTTGDMGLWASQPHTPPAATPVLFGAGQAGQEETPTQTYELLAKDRKSAYSVDYKTPLYLLGATLALICLLAFQLPASQPAPPPQPQLKQAIVNQLHLSDNMQKVVAKEVKKSLRTNDKGEPCGYLECPLCLGITSFPWLGKEDTKEEYLYQAQPDSLEPLVDNEEYSTLQGFTVLVKACKDIEADPANPYTPVVKANELVRQGWVKCCARQCKELTHADCLARHLETSQNSRSPNTCPLCRGENKLTSVSSII